MWTRAVRGQRVDMRLGPMLEGEEPQALRPTHTIKLLHAPQSETGASSHSHAHRRLRVLTGGPALRGA